MMIFTDDDLKRLNLWCAYIENKKVQNEGYKEMIYVEIKALLARLEAAENVCAIVGNHLHEPAFFTAEDWYKAWRKAAGK